MKNKVSKIQVTKLPVLGFAVIAAIVISMAACGDGGDDDLPLAHTHQWGEWTVTTSATCIAKGEEKRTCVLDGSHIETQETDIDLNGHIFNNPEITPATCEEDGEEEGTCTLCSLQTTKTLPKIGHDWNEWNIITPATEDDDGEETRTCKRTGCDGTETQVIVALGHTHIWGEWAQTTAPTCTEAGEETRVCTLKETHIETRAGADALRHSYGDWTQTTAPTYTIVGVETRICTNDSSHKEQRAIPMLQPILVSSIILNKSTINLIVGETETLTATVSPADATNKTVSWASDNSAVATVGTSGLVTPVKSGTATITVTTTDGGYTALCEVTVYPADMARIPAGTFIMGSPETEPYHLTDETQHQVTLTKSFYMGKYQVTQEQYQAVIGSNPSYFTTVVEGEDGTPGKLPVEKVSWYDAIVFCNKLSVMEGLSPVYSISGSTDTAVWGTVPINYDETWDAAVMVSGANGYRLPTEAEWEYACRAGTETAWYTSNTEAGPPHLNTAAWYSDNAASKTHEVGLKTPNAWGLYDMHGNVYEWCWDWYVDDYPSGAQTDPDGAVAGTGRVARGGDWSCPAQYLRFAFRGSGDPSILYFIFGFRVVRS
jgi:formylglycine-generating enzyme required for sulfatase activity